MKHLVKIVGLVGLLITLSDSYLAKQKDLLGWEAVRWGMSEKDILKVFGDKLKKLPKRMAFLRWHSDYVIPNYRLADEIFTVFFQMDDDTNKLSQVLTRLNEQKSQVPRIQLYNRLELILARKFGFPCTKLDNSSSDQSKNVQVIDLSCTWKFPTTNVELAYSWDNEIYASLLTVSHSPAK